MRIAFISDIHGNGIALEAVLADIERTGVDQIICLGDVANLGPHPQQCLDIVSERCEVVLQGNHELYVLGQILGEDWQTCPTWSAMRWTRSQMRPDQMQLMAQLPKKVELNGNGRNPTLLVHASPRSQYAGFYAHQAEADVANNMQDVNDVTLFCGHTHVQLYRRWSNSWIINVGSVGMPLDDDPAVKYVIATQGKQGWAFDFRSVTYDLAQLMSEFERVGLQKKGQVITALCRYQMLTGRMIFYRYANGLRQRAAELNVPVGDIYRQYPVPAEVQQWVKW